MGSTARHCIRGQVLLSAACEDEWLADNWHKGAVGSHGDVRRRMLGCRSEAGQKGQAQQSRQRSCLCAQQPVVLGNCCWAWGAIKLAWLMGEMVSKRG